MLKKLLTFILLLTLIATNIASIDAAYAARSKNRVKAKGKTPASAAISSTVSKKRALPKIPPFPEKAPAVDWTQVDWDKQMVLEGDKEEYHRTLDRLEVQNKRREAGKLKLKTYRMSDDEVLQYYNVPLGVREAVFQYRNGVKSAKNAKQKMNYKKQLQAALLSKGFGGTSSTAMQQQDVQKNQIIDVSKATPLKNLKLINVGSKAIWPRIKVLKQTKLQQKQQRFFDVTFEGLIRKSKSARTRKFSNALDNALDKTLATIKGFFIDTAYAEDTISPFIEYYDGIEKNAVDSALYYLSQNQNSDGSLGNFNKYELTAQIVFMASEFNLTDKGQFNAAISYLTATEPQNNREKALKARVLLGLGQPYQQILDEIIADKNADGGFGLEQNYLSDPQTTMEVAFALYAADYGTETHLAQALNFVLNNIKADGSMYYTKNGVASIYLAGKTAEYLKPFQDFAVGDAQNQVTVQSKIDALLGFLTNNYETADDAIDQTLIARAFQLYDKEKEKQANLQKKITQSQFADGRFGTSLYATISAMRALASAEIELADLTNIGNLINKQTAQFQLTIKNKGYRPINKAVLYLFADNVNLNSPIDLTANNIEIAPQSSVNVTITFDDTSRFLGSTEMKFFIESADSEISHSDNWIAKNFTFAPAPDSSPALPMYYIAYSDPLPWINKPVITIRWQTKYDPNLSEYAIVWREKGTLDWEKTMVEPSLNPASLYGAFIEDKIYEFIVGVPKNGTELVEVFGDITEVQATVNFSKYSGELNGFVTDGSKFLQDVKTSVFAMPDSTSNSNGVIQFNTVPNGSNVVRVTTQYYEPIYSRFKIQPGQTTNSIRAFTRLKSDEIPPNISKIEIAPASYAQNFKFKNQGITQITVNGSDNISLSHVDFYYWDPMETSWIFLGSEKTPENYDTFPVGTSFNWYIPSTLIGNDYKLKVIGRDYSGNKSEPKEFGPFEIIDGSVPTGSVNIAGLNNNQWSLGETKTISWDIETSQPLQQIKDIILKYDDAPLSIADSYDVAKTFVNYMMPLNASLVTNKAYIELTACYQDNNCAVILSPSFEIVDKTPPPHPPWQPSPFIFEGFTPALNLERQLKDVFHNQDDSIEIIYKETLSTSPDPMGAKRRLVYRKMANGQWQSPLILKEIIYIEKDYTEKGIPSVNLEEIKAVQSKNGNIHLVYKQIHESYYPPNPDPAGDLDEIYYINLFNGQIITDKQISNDETYSLHPDIAVNDSGIVSITWLEGFSKKTNTGANMLHYIQGDGLQTWGSTEELTDDSTWESRLSIDDNNPVVFYAYKDKFNIRKQTNDGWSAPAGIAEINPYYAIDTLLFSIGEGMYDVFYIQWTGKQNELFETRIYIDPITNIGTKIYTKIISDQKNGSVQKYDVLKNINNKYNVFYIAQEIATAINRPFYLLSDGNNTYFKTYVAPLLMNVEPLVITGNQKSNILMVFFTGGIGGQYGTLYNIADYSGIIDYKIDPVFPLDGATDITKQNNLQWQVEGGDIDSFDVYFGTDPYYLTEIANGITDTSFTMPALNSQTTYYWYVVEHSGTNLIYSNPWSFSTQEIENAQIAIEGDFDFGKQKTESSTEKTFIIKNNGTTNLTLTGTPFAEITGSNEFSVIAQPNAVIAPGNSTAFTIKFQPTSIGSKSAKISIASNDSSKNPYEFSVIGEGIAPLTVSATAEPASGIVPLKVQFDATVTGGMSSNYTYEWDVQSDGVIDYVTKNPVDTYAVVGVHTATLKVSDGFDNVAKTLTITVKEKPLPLTVTATADLISGTAPLTVKFDAQVKNAETGNITYEWDINRDGIVDYNIKNPIHTYTQPGKYYVVLKVSESNKTAISKLNITVKTPRPLNASISALPKSGTAPLKVHFYAVAGGGQSKNYTYEWDVNNDGVIDYTVKNPSHTYTTAGDHTVSLTVLDGVESITKKIVIKVD